MNRLRKLEKLLDHWLGKLLRWQDPVPEMYREESLTENLRENINRLFPVVFFLFVVESILFFFENYFFSTGPAILVYLIASAVLYPLVVVIRTKHWEHRHFVTWTVQTLLLANFLVYGVNVALISQRQGDASHIYFVMAMGVAVFFYLSPIERLAHLVSSYLVYAALLPEFQPNPRLVGVLRVNALVLILIALLMSRIVNQMRMRMFLSQKEIAAKNTALERLLMLDQMTQLLNHETAFKLLQHEIRRANRIDYPLSLILFDIDDFKRINDQHGHLVGDQVIRDVAVAMLSVLRQTDLAGRYGGEEFVIILPNTTLVEAMKVAERVQSAIAELRFDSSFKITVSGGVSEFEGESVLEFVNRTDAKLYTAKHTGKNRFVPFDDTPAGNKNPLSEQDQSMTRLS